MKNIVKIISSIVCISLIFYGCERDIEDLELAKFPDDPNVFIDGFSGGLEYAAFGGSKVTAFEVVDDIKKEGTSSMRFEVPDPNDPLGNYAGGVFFVGGGRDLSNYNVLSFWARASKAASIDLIGFGNDLGANTYETSINGLDVTTNWKKYYIPIPDPSKLTQEKGMFFYSEGAEDGRGYTFWIDEVKFENLGSVSHFQPFIFGEADESSTAFIGSNLQVQGLGFKANIPTGINQSVNCKSSYFDFQSSNPSTAIVDQNGTIQVVGSGETVITASVGGQEAIGSLTVNSLGDYISAPTPTEPADQVISIFSDAYENVPVDYYNGFFNDDGQTTQGGTGPGGADFTVNGDGVINYTSLNFVGIGTFLEVDPIDATNMTHLHVDINVNEELQAGDFINLQIINSVGNNETSGTFRINASELSTNEWRSFDIPLTSFSGLGDRSELGLLFFISDNTIGNIYVDNIYYYNNDGNTGDMEPSEAAPTPTFPQADVISIYSNAYTNEPVDVFRTSWSEASFEEVTVQDNDVLKYTLLNFVGIETVMNQIDAAEMTHFHIDIWSPNFDYFAIKLVDFGPNGVFDGGDDTEHEIQYTGQPQGEWISLDIPLSDFQDLVNRNNIAQYIMVARPTGNATLFVDNIFFHK